LRQYAWVELQLGLLALARGRHDDARVHYERSAKAYSGHWMADEHLAELAAAQGRFDEAVRLYRSVVERTARPEFQQALGEVYLFMGEPDRAEPWFEQALATYLASAHAGGVHYYHHLADFYADVREDGAEAVRWARKDIALRANFATQAALAWALYRDSQLGEAAATMDRALASGVSDARIFAQAATIREALGDREGAAQYTARADARNPHHRGFHVHR
jgi:tetratricopeptide (TPR) repeat protein